MDKLTAGEPSGGGQPLLGSRPNMGQFRASVAINSIVRKTGVAVVVLMCWMLVSGVAWRWELW